MEREGEHYVEAVEGLTGSWQDLRGRDGLEDSRWETVAGARHQDVVVLDGTVQPLENFPAGGEVKEGGSGPQTGCTAADDDAAGVEGGKACRGEEAAWDECMGSPASSSELMRFDEDAEVVAASKPLTVHFDEVECVHPEHPVESAEEVHGLEDDQDGDHEASSLVGSDHEYAFVYERAPEVKSEGRDETQGRVLPLRSPKSPRPGQKQFEATPLQTLQQPKQATPKAPPVGGPLPKLPSNEAHNCQHGAAGCADDSREVLSSGQEDPAKDAAVNTAGSADTDEAMEEVDAQEESRQELQGLGPAQEKAAQQLQDGSSQVETREPIVTSAEADASQTAAEEHSKAEEEPSEERDYADAAQLQLRRRNLDAVGVIPGGRAAFGAVAPSAVAAAAAAAPSGAKACAVVAAAALGAKSGAAQLPQPQMRRADSGGVVPGGRTAFGAPAPLAPGQVMIFALGGGGGGGGGGGCGRAASAGPLPATRLRLQLGSGTGLRRTAPEPGPCSRLASDVCDVLLTYDSLWHGGAAGVAEIRQLASHS